MTEKNNTKNLVTSALFAAIIMVFTSTVKIPAGNGYIHFGDSMIYLCSCLLPMPYALGAAAVGGALADIMAGFPVWALPTAIIKTFNAVPFTLVYMSKWQRNKLRIMSMPTAVMAVVSGMVTVLGYFIAETVMYGFAAACASVPGGIVQATGSAVVFCAAASLLDCAKFKSRIMSSKY